MRDEPRTPDPGPQEPSAVSRPEEAAWRPGAVPWGWRQALLGILVAAAPAAALQLLALLAGGDAETESGESTTGAALAGVLVTLFLDSWWIFAAWLFSLRGSGRGLASWGFTKPNARIVWSVPAALGIVFTLNIVYSSLLTPEQQDVVGQFPHNTAGLILFVLLACVIAPLYEEVFFRGFLFQAFAHSWGVPVGAVLSAALFGLSHLQLDVAFPLFALGLGLAGVFLVTRSLWGCIALHAAFNAIAVAAWAWG